MKVTAVLVCHDGGRWLPAVVEGLQQGSVQPDRTVVVDTGSGDDSVALVEPAFGPVQHAGDVPYGAAVAQALAQHSAEDPDEWVWLLHDDARPDPECLAHLRRTAEDAPDNVAALGPKMCEWPSLKRLLEVGVTISGTGKRETGLETGEYDQGQYHEEKTVLAVNTAGMLVRRSSLESLGLAPDLPLYGNDLDFGWRLARAGRRTLVVPDATMYHAEASHRGMRETSGTTRPRRDERAAAIFTLLANGSTVSLPWRLVRLFFGGLLRALGFLLVRAGAEARDELAAVSRVYAHPGRVLAGRSQRRHQVVVPASVVRPLLAPVWMPYRHGLDFVVEVYRALRYVVREKLDLHDTGDDRPWFRRLVGSVDAWAVLVSVVVALVASRGLLSGPPLHGGALLPAPDGVGHWWHTWASGWHWVGQGSDASGPAYLLPLALVGSVLFAQPGWVVWLLFVLTVPLTLVGALRALRRMVPGRWAPLWGAAAFALLPVVTGAVAQGRLGTVAGALLLPWVVASALRIRDDDPDRRARAVWRTALGAGLLATFVPLAVVLVWLVLVAGRALGLPRLGRGHLAVLALVPVAFLLPWLVELVRAPGAVLVEAGRAGSGPVDPGIWQVLAGTTGGPGSLPFWLTLGIPFAALVALFRADTRGRVLRCWGVALLGALLLTLVTRADVTLPGIAQPFRAWPGFWLVVVSGGLVAAAVLAADGAEPGLGHLRLGWRQPVGALALLAAVYAPVGATVWWVWHGTGQPLQRSSVEQLPEYLSGLAATRHDGATLVMDGGPGTGDPGGVQYRVMRSGSLRLGDDAVLSMTRPSSRLHGLVGRLVTADASSAARDLASYGISYVYAPAPVSPGVSSALDASDGFATASTPQPGTRVWRVAPAPNLTALDPSGPWWRVLLVVGQVVALIGTLIMALPSRANRGSA
ncbi:MAG: glycosyltransferase [Marmoricola sp.]